MRRSRPYRPGRPIVVEIAAGAVVLHPERDRVLLLHERDEDRWTLPKGHVESGESLEECARREVHEETGLSRLRWLRGRKEITYMFYDPARRTNVFKVVLLFLARSSTELVTPEPIFDRWSWVGFGTALARVPYPNDRETLRWARRTLKESEAGATDR